MDHIALAAVIRNTLYETNWKTFDIKGVVGVSSACPVANYIREIGEICGYSNLDPLVSGQYVYLYDGDAYVAILTLPIAASEFVRAFDLGYHPELELTRDENRKQQRDKFLSDVSDKTLLVV